MERKIYTFENTENYTQAELDALNAEIEARLAEIDPMDYDARNAAIKRHADEVAQR
jgi:hypothetical protein